MINPILQGLGAPGGNSYQHLPYEVTDQSFLQNRVSSISGSVGSKTIPPLCLVLKNANIWNNTSR